MNIEFFDYLEAIRTFRTLESGASSLAILMNVKQQRPSSDLAEKSVQQIEFVWFRPFIGSDTIRLPLVLRYVP